MKPRPWQFRYETQYYKGILPFELSEARTKRLKKLQVRPTEYDLMWHYRLELRFTDSISKWKTSVIIMYLFRASIPEDEQREIYAEVCPELEKHRHHKKTVKRKIEFVPPVKTA